MKTELKELQTLLAKRELTAPEIAAELKCSLPTVYRRMKALADMGAAIVEVKEPHSRPGPTPARFRLGRAAGVVRIGTETKLYGA
jgi:predicted transcriptional regulator